MRFAVVLSFCAAAPSLATAPFYVLANYTILGIDPVQFTRPETTRVFKNAVVSHLYSFAVVSHDSVNVLYVTPVEDANGEGSALSCLLQDTSGLVFSEGGVIVALAVSCETADIAASVGIALKTEIESLTRRIQQELFTISAGVCLVEASRTVSRVVLFVCQAHKPATNPL
jgi:hypothetical protein